MKIPPKNIAGLAFISNGLCEVDRVDLTGNDGVIVYRNEFEKSGEELYKTAN